MSYDKQKIAAGYVRDVAVRLTVYGFISIEQLTKVTEQFKTDFYTPSFFVRIGLFIFTLILVNAAAGIVGLTFSDFIDNTTAFGILLIAAGACLTGILEYFIHTKHHYKSGIDDCLLYSAVVFLITGIVLVMDISDALQIGLITLPVLVLATRRYADSLVALISFICFYLILFLFFKEFDFGRMWMPFIFLILSGMLLAMIHYLLKKEQLFYYRNCFKVLKVAALLALYLSMNYFVVKEGNRILNATSTEFMTNDIPLSFVFLSITGVLPIIYIFLGLRGRDRLLLWTGLGILVLTIFTLKYRYEFIQYEYIILWSGLAALLISGLSIRYLKHHSEYFTFKRDPADSKDNLMNAEAIAISVTLGQQDVKPHETIKFGGGEFGGGGAGGL